MGEPNGGVVQRRVLGAPMNIGQCIPMEDPPELDHPKLDHPKLKNTVTISTGHGKSYVL